MPLPQLLWPLLARKPYEIEKICWHTTESSHWEESNAKNPIKIGWIFHLLQNHIFSTLWPLLYKNRKKLQKNAWSNFCCFFLRNHLEKSASKSDKKLKFFHIKGNWLPLLPTNLTPFSSKTVRDRENLLTNFWKPSLREIKCKKPHQNF